VLLHEGVQSKVNIFDSPLQKLLIVVCLIKLGHLSIHGREPIERFALGCAHLLIHLMILPQQESSDPVIVLAFIGWRGELWRLSAMFAAIRWWLETSCRLSWIVVMLGNQLSELISQSLIVLVEEEALQVLDQDFLGGAAATISRRRRLWEGQGWLIVGKDIWDTLWR